MRTKIPGLTSIMAMLFALFTFAPVCAENWPQFRRDERHSGWAATTLAPPLRLVHDGTLRTYRSGAWVPADGVQVDTLTVRGDVVMLMGSVAGGDPSIAHGAARWAAYVSRARGWANAMPGGTTAYRPSLYFLESSRPKAGIETDSGHHPCQFSLSGRDTGGWLMESGLLQFFGGTVTVRRQSDIFGPAVCRDDDSEGVFVSRQQWHGGGTWAKRIPMRGPGAERALWAAWGAVPDGPNDREVLGYTVAYDAVYAGPYLVTNFVGSVGQPWNLPRDFAWPPELSGLCTWRPDPQERLTCREGSWGQLATDGELLWTYRQTEYERTPPGYWAVGGASRELVALRLPDLTEVFHADVGLVPLTVQDAPLVGPSSVVTVAWRDGTPHLDAYDRASFARQWSAAVPLDPRDGGCAYWPARSTEQVALAGAGESVIVASRGLTLLDVVPLPLSVRDAEPGEPMSTARWAGTHG